MKLRKHLGLFLSLALLFSILNLSCYTKVALLKNAPKYELFNTWIRSGGGVSEYNGVVSAHQTNYSITFSDDNSFKYSCDVGSLAGTIEIIQDTILIKVSENVFSKYRYELEGEKLNFLKLDSLFIPSCYFEKEGEFIEGAWLIKK